jgi:hypothetical protein
MPITPIGDPAGSSWRIQLVGPNDVTFFVDLAFGASDTEAQRDAATQSLVNHLSEWEDVTSISATKTISQNATITPDE